MHVKICGIKHEKDALHAEKIGADFIGFVFAPSKRRISPVNAAKIVSRLASNIKTVGVFVNEPIENMIHIAKLVGLDYIQLHGNEPEDIARKLPFPIIKAFSIGKVNPSLLCSYPCDYVLIDSPGATYEGGSGKVFDWNLLEQYHFDRSKFILAGGLSPNNVKNAINIAHPIGVDVSSGVETNGEKDQQKMIEFIQQAKNSRKVEAN